MKVNKYSIHGSIMGYDIKTTGKQSFTIVSVPDYVVRQLCEVEA